MEHAWPLRVPFLLRYSSHSPSSPLRFSPFARLWRFLTNGEGTEGISNSTVPFCAACWWFQSGDCSPNEYLPLTDVCLNRQQSFLRSPMTAVAAWIHAQKSSHLCKWMMKILQLLFLLDFSFPDLVWNSKGSCSYFSICPLPKVPRSSRGRQAGVLNDHNRCAPSPCDDSGQD